MQSFLAYIEGQKKKGYHVHIFKEDGAVHAEIKSGNACGFVTIYEITEQIVVELQVRNLLSDEAAFYLHFELQEIGHAKELFDEMMRVLGNVKQKKRKKILLCCTSGLTTSFFVMKLQEACRVLELELDFQAVDYNRLFMSGFDCDAVLLAPQIAFMQDKVKEILRTCPVAVVPAGIFGTYDVTGLLQFADKVVEDGDQTQQEQNLASDQIGLDMEGDALCVAVFLDDHSVRLVYRIYRHGTCKKTGQVLKESYRLRDLEDFLDVVLKERDEIHTVIICTPGILQEGRLTFKQPGICNVEVQHRFERRYHRAFCFVNDADAMALGYYGMHEGIGDVSFYFHPLASRTSGVGSIVNGTLLEGKHGIAGEMQYIAKLLRYSKDPRKLAMTPEGTLEVVAKYLAIIIAELDPAIIVVYCNMVPDMEELRSEIGKYIKLSLVPQLVKVYDPLPYMFAGGMMRASIRRHNEG